MIDAVKAKERARITLAALFGIGAALRLFYNNLASFSRADETNYLLGARALAGHFIARFPQFALDYANTPGTWDTPPPVRWGHWALISAVCGLSSDCNYSTLAWISTLGGIAALLFTWLLGKELLGSKPALVAVALSLASPLQLHLGRRALQDELVCAITIAALWSVARALSPEKRDSGLGPHLLAVLLCTIALAEKETSLLWAPPLLVLWLLRHRARGWCRRDLLFLLPPLLFFAGFCALSRSFTLFFRDAGSNLGTLEGSRYVALFMSGPPHRYLLDLLALAPLPFILGAAACGALLFEGSPASSGARELAAMLCVALLVWAPTPKDVRYLAAADALFSLLAAWLLVAFAERRRAGVVLAAALVALSFGSGLILFQRIFIEGAVYDPTTFEILRALDAIPH